MTVILIPFDHFGMRVGKVRIISELRMNVGEAKSSNGGVSYVVNEHLSCHHQLKCKKKMLVAGIDKAFLHTIQNK